MKRLTISATLALVLSVGLTDRSDAAALSLDGDGDWVDLAATATGVYPSGAAPFTVGAWINPTSIPAGGANGGTITFWGTQGPTNNAHGFRLRGDSGVRHYFWGNDHDENLGQNILPDTSGPNGDGWHHFAVSYDGNETNWYWNGAPLGAPRVAGAMSVADANHRIGSRLGAEFFHGYIDEITVWGAALGAADIASGWNAPVDTSDPVVQAALVAYYNFEQGNSVTDIAGLGGAQNGVFMGDATVDGLANAPLIPEPSSALLGLLGLGLFLRRKR